MEKLPKILLIYSTTEDKLDRFKPLFEKLKGMGKGKLTSNYFIIDSSFELEENNDIQKEFNKNQIEAKRQGYEKALYSFLM